MNLPVIETERLILRPFSLEDASEVQRMAGDRAIADTCQVPHPYPDGEAEDWIKSSEAAFDRREEMALAIIRKSDFVLVGSISLFAIFEGHQAELGFWVGKEFWGNGYATEASLAVIEWGFVHLDLLRVHACHMSRNPSSGKVLAKAGMIHEGSCPKHFLKWGIAEDLELWGILREDAKTIEW